MNKLFPIALLFAVLIIVVRPACGDDNLEAAHSALQEAIQKIQKYQSYSYSYSIEGVLYPGETGLSSKLKIKSNNYVTIKKFQNFTKGKKESIETICSYILFIPIPFKKKSTSLYDGKHIYLYNDSDQNGLKMADSPINRASTFISVLYGDILKKGKIKSYKCTNKKDLIYVLEIESELMSLWTLMESDASLIINMKTGLPIRIYGSKGRSKIEYKFYNSRINPEVGHGFFLPAKGVVYEEVQGMEGL